MTGRLQKEIKQIKPFDSPQQELFLNLLRTADAFGRAAEKNLKPEALSLPQYNILRVLRGAASAGISCRELGDRLITWSPDLTRLLDKLEKRQLISRNRNTLDRRVVNVRITPGGLELLRRLDAPVKLAGQSQMRNMSSRELKTLINLLEKLREGLT
jgi:DNA-binding MarR family transcriptional regulator